MLRSPESQELLDALVALETAAWSRRWSDLKRARAKVEEVAGVKIVGPLRRQLEESEKAS